MIRGMHLNWGVKESFSEGVKAYKKLSDVGQKVQNMELSREYYRQSGYPGRAATGNDIRHVPRRQSAWGPGKEFGL